MHNTTKLLVGVCAAAFVATTAAAQTTGTRDTTTTRARRIAGSGIRVTKEGPETRTGTASGVYGGTSSTDTLARASSSTSPSTCTGVNCSPNRSVASGINNNPNGAACTGVNCPRTDSLNNGTVCTGTNCTGNSNTNANACMGTSCNSGSASSSCSGVNCPTVSPSVGTLVPSNADTMTAADADMGMFGIPDTQFLQGMTDENILAHLAMGDSMEIRMAQHAVQQTQTPSVRDFANTLIADHTASLQQGRTAAQQAGITPQLAVGDTAGMRMMDHMNMPNMSGNMNMNMSHGGTMAYSDANFIRHNVMMHRHMLSELQTLSGVAKSDAVKSTVSASIPVVQKHLTTAQQLATDLHVDLNAHMKMNMGTTTPPPTR